MALASKQQSGCGQQNCRNDATKQLFHVMDTSIPNKSHGETQFPACAAPPNIGKSAPADFSGLLPLSAALPMAGRCQGPTSSQTGRLADDCASNRPALTADGNRSTIPQGEQTLVKADFVSFVMASMPFLTRSVAFPLQTPNASLVCRLVYLRLRFIFRLCICGVMARSILPPIFCAMFCISWRACRRSCGS